MLTMLIAFAAAASEPAPTVQPGLEPLAFLVGHCWRGDFGKGEQDTHCFDAVYGGQHVRDRHEVTGGKGVYKGEAIYSFDGKAATFTYWNSQGGVSRGTMRASDGRIDFGDESYTDPSGRRITISTYWRRDGADAYEAITASSELPSMNRTVRYQRVADVVEVSKSQALDGTHTLVHQTEVEAPVAKVWEAIATAQGWRTWATPVAWSPEPGLIETSYTPTASPGDSSTIRQLILASVPGRMMAFRTIKAPEGFPHFDVYTRTTALFELEPVNDRRTRVRLTTTGYPDTEAGRQLLGFFEKGNRVSLDQLRVRFASGPLDWSGKQRVAASGKGK
jgi:uncharacterized protein YndB with AHSA1/START domain